MLCREKHYDFRARLDAVHRNDRRNPNARVQQGEWELEDGVAIACPDNASAAVRATASDLVDYLRVSMGVESRVTADASSAKIVLEVDETIGCSRSFRYGVSDGIIHLTGADGAGVRRAGVYLEDRLNMREGPYFADEATVLHAPLYSPRIVHSGWGLELYPDAQLNATLHAGFDAIVVFYEGIDRTHIGALDFNDLIRRAAKYGLGLFFYSYLPCAKHPDEPGAREYYESMYTTMFEHYPDVAGLMLCAEDQEFPSHDERTSGTWAGKGGPFETRPSTGFFPCRDYPDFLRMIRDAVWKAKPGATIIFNTYNWGYQPVEDRREFVRNMPEGITLQTTYEIFGYRKVLGQPTRVADYSITADKPGYYFTSESQLAHEYGRRLLATTNSAGRTWDFGDAPYIPCVQRWMTRFREMDRARREYGLSGLYECHHYGWWPSAITDLTRAYFNSPQCDLDEELTRIARRMAGDGADELLAAWEAWSQAMEFLCANGEEQYGPLRVGPSYPLVFDTAGKAAPPFPCAPGAHFGNQIIIANYNPGISACPVALRFPVELQALEEFDRLWAIGLERHSAALAKAHPFRMEELEREHNLAMFLRTCAKTCYHVKKARLTYMRISVAPDLQTILDGLAQVEKIFDDEEANARSAIPLVEADSSLGWEGSMEYVCDREHLEWKLKVLDAARRNLNNCRAAMLKLNAPDADLSSICGNF